MHFCAQILVEYSTLALKLVTPLTTVKTNTIRGLSSNDTTSTPLSLLTSSYVSFLHSCIF
jgi:hypothetical protein